MSFNSVTNGNIGEGSFTGTQLQRKKPTLAWMATHKKKKSNNNKTL